MSYPAAPGALPPSHVHSACASDRAQSRLTPDARARFLCRKLEDYARELVAERISCKVFMGNVDSRASTEFITTTHPGEKLVIDVKHMWAFNGWCYFLVVVCHFSGMLWALPLRTKSAAEVLKAFKHVYAIITKTKHPAVTVAGSVYPCTNGWVVKSVQSDRGSEFVNEALTEFCAEEEIKRGIGRSYHPQTQGVRSLCAPHSVCV